MADTDAHVRLFIDLSWSDMQAFYQGEVSRIGGRSTDGRWFSLPASALRPFLRQDGIHGCFDLVYNRQSHRITRLTAVSED